MPRATRTVDRVLLTIRRACVEFYEDHSHRDAAQVSFFAVLSAVPLAMLLVAGFGLVLDEADVRRRVIEVALDSLPVTQHADRVRFEHGVTQALDNAGHLGPASALLLLFAASNVIGALRHAVNAAWDIENRPSLLRRKVLDVAMVGAATALMLLSLSLSLTHGAADRADDVTGGVVVAVALDGVAALLPAVFVSGGLLLLYRVLPAEAPHTRDIWPGAVVGAAGLFAVKHGLQLYLEHLTDYGALYGSLGAIMALLLFTYAAANVVVFGAEFASEWARLPEDDADVRAQVAADVRRLRRLLPGRS